MTTEAAAEQSPLDLVLESVAGDLKRDGRATRDLSPTDVVQLAQAVLVERGRSGAGMTATPIGTEDDPQLLVRAGNVELRLGNKPPRRREQPLPPDEEREVEVRDHKGLPFGAGALLGGINGAFKKQLSSRLEGKGAKVGKAGLQITNGGIHIALVAPQSRN